jgi:hypothetical protein
VSANLPPDGPSEEEVRQYLAQMRGAPVDQVLVEVVQGLLNAAQVKLGRNDARLLIDACAAINDTVRGQVTDELTSQVDQALSQLRLAQVEAEKEVAGQPEPNDLGSDRGWPASSRAPGTGRCRQPGCAATGTAAALDATGGTGVAGQQALDPRPLTAVAGRSGLLSSLQRAAVHGGVSASSQPHSKWRRPTAPTFGRRTAAFRVPTRGAHLCVPVVHGGPQRPPFSFAGVGRGRTLTQEAAPSNNRTG